MIVGAGAVGGTLGGRLAQYGHPAVLIARGEHGAAITADGLRLRSPDEDVRIRVPVAATPDEVELRDDDVLVFATKTQQVEAAVREWVDRPVRDAGGSVVGTAGELLPALTALNGVESERIALRAFARVFGVCVWLPGVHLTAGEVAVRIGPSSGTFIMGRFGGPADGASDAAFLEQVAADWRAATFRVFVVDDVMAWKHRKLLANLGNAVQALIGSERSGASRRLREEAASVYAAAGIEVPSDEAEEAWRGNAFDIRDVPGLEGELGGSSWQSLARGGSIETDFLNGEIVLLARSLGMRAPLNAVVQGLARRAGAARAGAGSMSAAELDAALAAGR
ncbi:hypothetical protein AS850_15135 [Frondihabitans sp. 762G35]|nr:hypothetical protein AS850_15135 [Frondihabitans sp. 762G35]